MYCRILAATALLAGSTLMATAQEKAPPPPPDGGPQAQEGAQAAPPPPPPGSKPGERRGWHHGKRGDHGMRHGPFHRGDRGPDMRGKGFELSLGWGRELQVNCGDEPIKACIDAAGPLIDSLSKASMPRHGPGMRRGRGVDMGPGGEPEPPKPDEAEQD